MSCHFFHIEFGVLDIVDGSEMCLVFALEEQQCETRMICLYISKSCIGEEHYRKSVADFRILGIVYTYFNMKMKSF